MVHHTEPFVDTLSSSRFHPIEGALFGVFSVLVTVTLGTSIFELLVCRSFAQFFSYWIHADLRLPRWLEYPMGFIFVTPGHHQVHHDSATADKNIGLIFTFWDQIFKTYKEPEAHPKYRYGLHDYAGESISFADLMLLRFKKTSAEAGETHPEFPVGYQATT